MTSADTLEAYFAKLRQVGLASFVHVGGVKTLRILRDSASPSTHLADLTGRVAPFRVLLDSARTDSTRNPVSGVTSSQAQTSHSLVPSPASLRAVREYRIIGAAPRRSSLAPRSASHRIAFDRRSGSCLNPIPITWLGVAGILVSTRLLHAQPILTLSCGDLLRYFN